MSLAYSSPPFEGCDHVPALARKLMWTDLKTELRQKARKFLIFWAIGSSVIFVGLTIYWLLTSAPTSLVPALQMLSEYLTISLVVPPLIWLIRMALY